MSLDEGPAERSRLRQLINRFEVDQAVFFAVAARAWSFLSGPITTLLIAWYFTPQLQDYFYVFASLLAMQAFFELSLDVVIVNIASHEWASLRLSESGIIEGAAGARSRLADLHHITRRWYVVAAMLFLVCVGVGGFFFLGQKSLATDEWVPPWRVLMLLASVQLTLMPAIAVLEGCGQLGVINRARMAQAAAGSLAVWSLIGSGAGLWAAVGAALVRLLWDLWLIRIRFRRFFESLRFRPTADHEPLLWREEIWPLQWRVGVQAVITYVSLFVLVPVMFQYHGPGVAGRTGMTWNILTALQTAAFSWVETRRPLFGRLIAARDYAQLDRFFLRLTTISVCVLGLGCAAFCLTVALLGAMNHWLAIRLSERLLPVLPTVLLALATLGLQIPRCQNIYIRAHKRDPFLVPSLVANLTNALLIWYFGRHYGPVGAAWAFLGTVGLVFMPWWWWIWSTCRREWHADSV